MDFWQSFSYKKKTVVLLICFLLINFIVYNWGIKKVIGLNKLKKSLISELKITENAELRITNANNYKNRIDDIIGELQSGELNNQEFILEKINLFKAKKNLAIRSFNEPHGYESGEFKIITYSFTLSGSFHNLLELLYQFETKYGLGRLISLEFTKEKNRNTQREDLIVHAYIQNVIIQERKNEESLSD